MNQAFEIAGVGLESQQRALDVIANNIANINTLGFKRADVRFIELIVGARDNASPSAALGGWSSLSGVMARTVQMIDRQGELEPTGSALDIAIDGDGFIEVMGADGQTLLWRGGRLSINAERLLATSDGRVLQDQIRIPDEAREIRIDDNGAVSAKLEGADDFVEIGRLSLTRVEDQETLERMDGGFYLVTDANAVYNATAGDNGAGAFVHGSLERSNVELSEEMVRLMLVQRAYAANAQIIQAADQLMGIANTLRR